MRKLQSGYGNSSIRLISKPIIFRKGLVYHTPGIYTEGYIVFGVCFFCSFILPPCSEFMIFRIYKKNVLVRVSQVRSGVDLSNNLSIISENIHIWTIVTLEGWHLHHDSRPQGPCPWVRRLEVKIKCNIEKYKKKLVKIYQVVYISVAIHFWTIVTLEGWHPDPRVHVLGWDCRSKYLKSVILFSDLCRYLTNHLLENIHSWTICTIYIAGFHLTASDPWVHAPGWV